MSNTTLSPRRSGMGALADIEVGRLLLEGRAFFALIVIIAVFSALSPYYFSLGNFLTMTSHVAIFGILAIGMLLVILNGGIDLSVGSTLGLSGVFAGFLNLAVNVGFLPVFEEFRFARDQIRLHGKIGARQVERVFVTGAHWRSGRRRQKGLPA